MSWRERLLFMPAANWNGLVLKWRQWLHLRGQRARENLTAEHVLPVMGKACFYQPVDWNCVMTRTMNAIFQVGVLDGSWEIRSR